MGFTECLPKGSRSQFIHSCEYHVLACISEMNGPAAMNFGVLVYNHEWIIVCSLSVYLKGHGHRSEVRLKVWKSYVAYISKMNGLLLLFFLTVFNA